MFFLAILSKFDIWTIKEGEGPFQQKQSFFLTYYDFGDKYVYVIGGQSNSKQPMKQCEKFDVQNLKWTNIASLNQEKMNPGCIMI